MMSPTAGERGYAMAALLVALSVMAIMLGTALPVWRTAAQREREAELVFRGEQYAQAIALFQRRTGGFPTSLEMLRDGRYIRKLYKDPITGGDFQPVYLGQVAAITPPGQATPGVAQPGRQSGQTTSIAGRFGQAAGGRSGQPGTLGAGPIIGVVSRSTATGLRLVNGRGKYNEWTFVSTAATQQPGAPGGVQAPGLRGRGGDGRGRGGDGRGRGEAAPGGLQQPGGRVTPGGQGLPGRQGFPGREGPGGRGMQPFGRPGGGFPQPGGGFPPPNFPGQRGRL